MTLKYYHGFAEHIDYCGSCCMNAWMKLNDHVHTVGWMEAPLKSHFCRVAIVFECQECFEKFWSHAKWYEPGIMKVLPRRARDLIQEDIDVAADS